MILHLSSIALSSLEQPQQSVFIYYCVPSPNIARRHMMLPIPCIHGILVYTNSLPTFQFRED